MISPTSLNMIRPLNPSVSKCYSLSRIRLFATPWTVAHQAPLSLRFSRQGCWSGLPFPSPGDLPYPGIEPGSPALQEMQVQSRGQDDRLEEVMAAHSSILDWRIPWTEEPDGLQSMRSERLGHN